MSRRSTTTHVTERGARLGGRVGALTLAALAAGAATALTVALATTPQHAQADPGDTVVPIGSSQLVQSEDLTAIQVPLDTEKVVLRTDPDFSACIGAESPWTQVLKGSATPVKATWTRRGHQGESVTELITQAPDAATADRWESTLVRSAVRACGSSADDFHYGTAHRDPVGSGRAAWALLYYGDHRRAEGGVVVVRKGTDVGFVQVYGTWGDAGQTMESVAKVAVDRLL